MGCPRRVYFTWCSEVNVHFAEWGRIGVWKYPMFNGWTTVNLPNASCVYRDNERQLKGNSGFRLLDLNTDVDALFSDGGESTDDLHKKSVCHSLTRSLIRWLEGSNDFPMGVKPGVGEGEWRIPPFVSKGNGLLRAGYIVSSPHLRTSCRPIIIYTKQLNKLEEIVSATFVFKQKSTQFFKFPKIVTTIKNCSPKMTHNILLKYYYGCCLICRWG